MKQLFSKFGIVFISITLFVVIGGFVVLSERAKRIAKTREYYNALNSDWNTYKTQYESEVARLRKENKDNMVKAQAEYDRLLGIQAGLIAQHTKSVAQGGSGSSQATTVTASNSPSKTTQTIKVSKPKSAPSTKAS